MLIYFVVTIIIFIIYIQSINKLYWRKTEGNTTVCFSNSPFTVDREVVLDCQYGPHYWKDKEPKNSYVYRDPERLVAMPTSRSIIILCIGIISYAMFLS